MSLFQVENPVVAAGSSSGSSGPARVTEWDASKTYDDGAAVIFNGSLYYAQGAPLVGVQPPVEIGAPVTPNQPRWALAARGRSRAVQFDPSAKYYADQVVTYLGGVYVLDVPWIAPNSPPPQNKQAWLKLSEVLTDAESGVLVPGSIVATGGGFSVLLGTGADEVARVARHFVDLNSAIFINGSVYICTFPRPMQSNSRPIIEVLPINPGSFPAPVVCLPLIGGGQCTGYQFFTAGSFPPGAYQFQIVIKQVISEAP